MVFLKNHMLVVDPKNGYIGSISNKSKSRKPQGKYQLATAEAIRISQTSQQIIRELKMILQINLVR